MYIRVTKREEQYPNSEKGQQLGGSDTCLAGQGNETVRWDAVELRVADDRIFISEELQPGKIFPQDLKFQEKMSENFSSTDRKPMSGEKMLVDTIVLLYLLSIYAVKADQV